MKKFYYNLHRVFKISPISLIFISVISLIISLTEIMGLGLLQIFIVSIFSNITIENNIALSFIKSFNLHELNLDKNLILYFLIFFYVFKNALQIFLNYIFFTFIEKQHVKLLLNFFSVMLAKSYQEIITEKSTKYNQIFSRYIENFVKNIIGGTLKVFAEIIFVFFIIAYLISIQIKLTIYTLVILLFFFIFYNLLIKKYLTKNSQKISLTEEILKNNIYEYIKNFREIFIFNLKNSNFIQFKLNSNKYANYEKKYLFISSVGRNIIEIILIICLLGYFIYNQNNIANSFSSVIIVIFALVRLLPSVNTINHNLAQISQHSYSIIELEKFLGSKLSIINMHDNRYEKNEKSLDYINIKNLSFYYNNNNYLFKNLNFNFYTGEIILIKGKSGSGKTTLVDTITGIQKPIEGDVHFYDKNNNKYNFNNFGFVSQNPTLFTNTLSFNLTFKKQLHDNEKEKLIYLINKLNLNINNESKNILNYEITEDGKNLSGGQLKKISLIRNYFANPQVIILDEITANLDSNSIEKVTSLINENKKDKIHFIISHSEESNLKYDKIINL